MIARSESHSHVFVSSELCQRPRSMIHEKQDGSQLVGLRVTVVTNTVHLYGASVLEPAIVAIKCGFKEIKSEVDTK